MKQLSTSTAARIRDEVARRGRPLELALIDYKSGTGDARTVLAALKPFQNSDGGFGHGLEPDFWMPQSSPMATSVGVGVLIDLGTSAQDPLVQTAMRYYEASYQPAEQRWIAVGPEVEQHPHAPWWSYEPIASEESDTWDGNPSAAIISQLLHYRSLVSQLDLEALIEQAITHLQRQERFETHEIQCYISLYGELPVSQKAVVKPILEDAIAQLIETDTSKWDDYVPKPLDFIKSPQSPFYEGFQDIVAAQLDYLIDIAEAKGFWAPTWSWMGDEEHWSQACQQWIGVLAYNSLSTLQAFNRIEPSGKA
jgi:hypothetical protein